MKLRFFFPLLACCVFAGCGETSASVSGGKSIAKEALQESQPMEDEVSGNLRFAVSKETLGLNPAFLEQRLGVPKIKNAYQMEFELEGCSLNYGLDGTRVISISAVIDSDCRIAIDERTISSDTTFGDIYVEWARYIADCFADCGNAYDPSVSLRLNGSRSNGFISISYGADYYDTSNAQDVWANELRQRLGLGPFENPTDYEAMHCVQNPSPRVKSILAEVKVTRVYIFSNADPSYC